MDTRAPAADRWYRQPIVWLGAGIFAASVFGWLLIIVLGARHADEPLPVGEQVFRVPLARPAPKPGPSP